MAGLGAGVLAEGTTGFSLLMDACGTVDVRVGKDGTGGTSTSSEEDLNIRFKPFFVPSIKDRRLFVDATDSREEFASLENARPLGNR
jgi:hypothetical protein